MAERQLVTLEQRSSEISEEESAALAKVVMSNDLSDLSPSETLTYYRAMCRMAGLNAINRPIEILDLDGKKVAYVTKRGGDELRFNHKLKTEIVGRELMMDGQVLRVTARVTFPDGRYDESDGVVPLVEEEKVWKTSNSGKRYPETTGKVIPLGPAAYANAVMKAETKAKRRATLSAVGLGMVDESEIETIQGARVTPINLETGEILDDDAAGGPVRPVIGPKPTATVSAPSKPSSARPAGSQAAKPAAGSYADGKAIHFRGKIVDHLSGMDWSPTEVDELAARSYNAPLDELDGDTAEALWRDLEEMPRVELDGIRQDLQSPPVEA